LSAFYPDESNRAVVRRRLGIPDGSVCLICIANLVEQKRLDVLLDAMAQVLGKGYSCRCLIVGDGPLQPELSRQAEALQLTSHVSFEGSRADVLPYLQAADAFVLTSNTEGLPLSVLEAMACGLPCIVTNVGGNAEAVRHEESGIVVPPGSPEEVARAIIFLIQQPRQRASMAEAARSRVRQFFDIEDCMARLRTQILA
jgi:glycosyltransferase involved in cell wall biosynthesis